MRQKLPVVLAATALVVAVFGATPLGHAAGPDSVRIDAPLMTFGATLHWDVGPFITLYANCYRDADGTRHLNETLLNNAPTSGFVRGSNVVFGLYNQVGPGIALGVYPLAIGSGRDAVLSSNADPSTKYGEGTSNFATFVWRDNNGETITGIYSSIVFADHCEVVGTLTRTT